MRFISTLILLMYQALFDFTFPWGTLYGVLYLN